MAVKLNGLHRRCGAWLGGNMSFTRLVRERKSSQVPKLHVRILPRDIASAYHRHCARFGKVIQSVSYHRAPFVFSFVIVVSKDVARDENAND
jgi:hypothetical protein